MQLIRHAGQALAGTHVNRPLHMYHQEYGHFRVACTKPGITHPIFQGDDSGAAGGDVKCVCVPCPWSGPGHCSGVEDRVGGVACSLSIPFPALHTSSNWKFGWPCLFTWLKCTEGCIYIFMARSQQCSITLPSLEITVGQRVGCKWTVERVRVTARGKMRSDCLRCESAHSDLEVFKKEKKERNVFFFLFSFVQSAN